MKKQYGGAALASRIKIVREIDVPDLEYERARHRELALEVLKKKHKDIIEALGINVLSRDPSQSVSIRLPPVPEHEFLFIPPSEQPQEGKEGQGEGQEQDSEGTGEGGASSRREIAQGKDLQKGQEIKKQQEKNQQGSAAGQGQEDDASDSEEGEPLEIMGEQAGSGQGDRSFETQIELSDVARKELDDLKLPNLREVALPMLERIRKRRPKGNRKMGPWVHRNIYRSARERLSRTFTMLGGKKRKAQKAPFWDEDIRFRFRSEEPEPVFNIVLVADRDRSGSMTDVKRRWSRSFLMNLVLALRAIAASMGGRLEIAFVVHDDGAQEVNEWEFFHMQSSGGTKMSKGVRKAEEILQRYPIELHNRIIFYLSDGENENSDKGLLREALESILPETDFFGYLEVKDSGSRPDVAAAFSETIGLMRDIAKQFPQLWVGPTVGNEEWLRQATLSLVQFCQERGE